MNLSHAAQSQSRLIYMLVSIMMMFGLVSYFTLPAQEDPGITVREAVVVTPAPGLSASQVERLVTRTLEEEIRLVPEVEELRSVSMHERSIIHVHVFDKYFELDQIWDEVRKKVEIARARLPQGIPAPRINDDFGDVAVLTAALSGPDYGMQELFDFAKHVRDRLQSLKGANKVEILAELEERVFIEIDNAQMAELGLSPQTLAAQVRAQNVLGAQGTLVAGDRRLLVRPSGDFESVLQLSELLLSLPDAAQPIPLGEVATIRRGYEEPPSSLAYVDGKRSIIITVSMKAGERALEFAPRVARRLKAIQASLPAGLEVSVFNNQALPVAETVFGVTVNVLETLAIVLGVVILFLGIRTGLIVGSIVPVVMLVTLAIMGFFSMPLERMSLATLVIALGLLVDNGIVVAEDFKRRLEDGEHRDAALQNVGRELSLPLLSSTLTTILVFLPLMLAQHSAGEYTRSISLVILISLSSSWLLAMTLTPLLCHRFIIVRRGERNRPSHDTFSWLSKLYQRALMRWLKRPMLFLALMASLLVLSGIGISKVPKKFFPDSNRTQILVYLDLEPSASIEATQAATERIIAELDRTERFPYVNSHAAYVGFGGPRFVLSLTPIDPAPNRAFIVVNVAEKSEMEPTMKALRAALEEVAPEVQARVKRMFLGPSDSSKIDIQVKGPDADVIASAALEIESLLRGVPGSLDIHTDWEGRVPTVTVEVDQAKARRAGASSAHVADAVARVLAGTSVGEFREGDDVWPIVLRSTEVERSSLARLKTAAVATTGGGFVPLSQVASVRLVNEHSRIARENSERTATVEGRSTLLTAEDMVPLLAEQLTALEEGLPPGHSIELDGVVTDSAEGQAALQANVPLCFGCMVLLLVGQFRSYRRPLIILGTIPLIVIGAVMGLFVMGAHFGFMVILGLYSLAGIIINNAIVLIDRIDLERAQSQRHDYDAILHASALRLRPIIMTTVTTILGLLPLIVFVDPLFYGMASVMSFGLLIGTFLTLGVVPVAYALLFSIRAPTEAA